MNATTKVRNECAPYGLACQEFVPIFAAYAKYCIGAKTPYNLWGQKC